MTLQSLGIASDLMAMQGLGTTEAHPDRIILRTPSEPDYWHGNVTIFLGPTDPLAALVQFQADHPTARHRVLLWDIPGPGPNALSAALGPLGFEVHTDDVLTLTGPIRPADTPPGIALRPLTTDDDWDQALALMLETAVEEGYEPQAHTPYLAARNANRRAQIAAGLGAWFGAFDGDLLVADMGMFHDTRVARYQSVETRASHRRRGICAALLAHACHWARARAPNATPVIIAEADSAAGRLYRSMGFALSERIVGATRPSAGSKS